MPKLPFNDATIAGINVSKTTWYTDSNRRAVRGLRLMAGAMKKTWYVTKRRPGGKVEQIKLGHFPELSVMQAQRKAGTAIGQIEDGRPARLNDAPRLNGKTLSEGLEEYIRYRTSQGKLSDRTAQEYRDVLRLHAFDWIERPLSALQVDDVTDVWLDLEERPAVGNHLIRVLRQVYRFHGKRDLSLLDPTRAVDLRQIKPRQMKCNDLGLVMADVLAVENPVRRTAWQLLLHTGIRTSNLRSLTWDDVDLKAKTVFLAKMKNGEARTLPLSNRSAALFRTLRRYDEKWCFPSFRRPGPIDNLDTLPHARQHDMRHWFTTMGARCQIQPYALAWLRGDLVRTPEAEAMGRYIHDAADHSHVNLISKRILGECV